MKSGHDWLPATAVARDEVTAQFATVVQQWSAAWFSHQRVGLGQVEVVQAGAPWPPTWRDFAAGPAVNISQRAMARLRDWALDIPSEKFPITTADSKVIGAFEDRILEDLIQRFGRLLPPPRDGATGIAGMMDHGGVRIGLNQEGELFSIALPLPSVMPLVRASLPAFAPGQLTGASRLNAVGSTVIGVEGVLGVARIALADLQALGPGDVLILDRTIKEKAVLMLEKSGDAIASAELLDVGDQLALVLQ